MKLNATEKNALQAVEYLLWEFKVRVSAKGLKEDMIMHPEFPSMVSISDALAEWQVPNMAVRLQAAQLKEIPLPSLAYINTRGGILAPLKSVTHDTVEWLDTKKGWQKDSLSDFEQKWNGITLLLEPNGESGEQRYSERVEGQYVTSVRTPFLIAGAVVCLAIAFGLNWNFLQSAGLSFGVLLAVKLFGMIVSGLLLWQSLDADNPFLQNICHLGSQGNCNGILQSKASKISSWLSWSEVGFVYFTGGFFGLLFALTSGNFSLVAYLALLSMVALPYTIYSVWYQRFVAKEWCTLCMLVQITLWGENAILFTYSGEFAWVLKSESLALLALAFLMPTLIWILIKKPLTEALQLFDVQRELQKVKFNENYIRATFGSQTKMPPIFEDMQTAAIGNLDAPHVVTVVTNPLCGPCSRLHGEINHLVESDKNFKCQFVFLGPAKAWQIASGFLSATTTDRKVLMDSWYSNIQQDAEKWIGINKVEVNPHEVNPQVRLHGRWSELAGVTGTPTVYVNGVKLSAAFKIRDLKRVVPFLNREEGHPVSI